VTAAYAGQVVVVTGASQGIGKALCLALAPRKPRLVLAARDRPALDAVSDACRELGAETLVVPTDVSDSGDAARLVTASVERFGGVDVLVANAGITMVARFDEVTDLSIFDRVMRVNYLGSVYPTYFALPHLKRSRGQIVVVASLTGLTGVPTRTAYSASKHALFGLYESLRIELRRTGVSITMVAPDFVLTETHRRAAGPDGRPLGKSPMQEARLMTAEECARRIVGAMERRQRLLILSLRGKLGRFVKLVAPGLIDAIAEKAMREGR